MRSQDAALEVGEVIELAEFSGLVRIVQVPDEPVRRVSQDILLDRTDFLRGVDETEVVLRPFFRCPHPDVEQIVFLRRRQDIVCFFDVDQDVRRKSRRDGTSSGFPRRSAASPGRRMLCSEEDRHSIGQR